MKEEKKFNLSLNVNEVNVVLSGLMELQYKHVAGLVHSIQMQVNNQVQEDKNKKVQEDKKKNKKIQKIKK